MATEAMGGADQAQLTADAARIFTADFRQYQKMTEADYLEHTILFAAVQQRLKAKNKPLRMLDLGCGDSRNITKVLGSISHAVASYTGVDMTESALDQAFEATSGALGPNIPAAFHLADMLTFLKRTKGTYDIVLAAFSLHHLSSPDKAETLKEIYRLVSPAGGEFIMVDPFRRENEDLAAYHKRATEVGETWTFLGPEQQQKFIKHMQDYDIVESQAFFQAASQAVGFGCMEVILKGSKGLESCVTAFSL